MNKIIRTFRLDPELSKGLDKLNHRRGDKTYHLEKALRSYLKRKGVLEDKS